MASETPYLLDLAAGVTNNSLSVALTCCILVPAVPALHCMTVTKMIPHVPGLGMSISPLHRAYVDPLYVLKFRGHRCQLLQNLRYVYPSATVFDVRALNAPSATMQPHFTVSRSALLPAISVLLTTFFVKYCNPVARLGISLHWRKSSMMACSSFSLS